MSKEQDNAKKISVGGQALIEGVMMKGPKKTVLAVRHIVTKEITVKDIDEKKSNNRLLKLPLIRGVYNMVMAMITGYKTLMMSADLSGMTELEEEEERKKREAKGDKSEPKKLDGVLMSVVMGISAVLGVALAVALFMWLPTFLFNLLKNNVTADISNFRALLEGILKIIIFLIYLFAVSQMNDIKRVFKYHGAEHKSIFCFEHHLPLTVENVRQQKRFHPRCGTSFMFLMILVGILISTVIVLLFPNVANYPYIWVPTKILLVPLFCGVGYELIKICSKYDNIITKIIAAPGLWIQRLTTKEPDDEMIEVAIESLKAVLPPEMILPTDDEKTPSDIAEAEIGQADKENLDENGEVEEKAETENKAEIEEE